MAVNAMAAPLFTVTVFDALPKDPMLFAFVRPALATNPPPEPPQVFAADSAKVPMPVFVSTRVVETLEMTLVDVRVRPDPIFHD
jgi:hypothetical protein